MTTPKLALPELSTSQAGKELTHNQALAILDQLAQARVIDKDLATPPGSPANGAAYIVAGSPTGAWSGKAGQIAFWLTSVGAWTFCVPLAGWSVRVIDELDGSGLPKVYAYSGAAWVAQPSGGGSATMVIPIACSDETTALASGTAKVTLINPFSTAFSVTGVVASLTTAQTGGSIFTVDINEAGTSILSTKLTIDNTEKNSSTAATAAVISDSSIAAYAEITIDIDQVGDGTAKGLKVYLIGSV